MASTDRPANELKSTIDVQLSLMKSQDIDSLKNVFNQFGKNIQALSSLLGSVAPPPTGGASGATPYSSNASTHQSTAGPSAMKNATVDDQRKEQQRQQESINNTKQGWIRNNFIDPTHRQIYNQLTDPNTHAFSNLLYRGELKNWRMRDMAGVAAYGLGQAYYGKGGMNNPDNPGLALPAAALGVIGAGGGDAIVKGIQGATNFLRAPQAAMFGSQTGQSTNGIIGRIGSPAWTSYMRSQLSGLEQSGFGFNLSYSTAQAQEAQALLNSYGYRGSLHGQVANALSTVTGQIPAISQSQQMSMIDPAVRYGTASVSEMVSQMQQIPNAAKAAMTSVSAFTDQLIATSAQISQQTGAPTSAVQGQILAYSQGTGLSPSASAGVIGNEFYQNVAAAQSGGNFYKATFGPGAGTARQKTLQGMVERVTGHSWAQLQQLARHPNSEAWSGTTGVMNKLTILYRSPAGKQLFGGLTPPQIANLIRRGHNPASMTHAATILEQASRVPDGSTGQGKLSIKSLMQDIGMSAADQSKFLTDTSKHPYMLGSSVILPGASSYQDRVKKLEEVLSAKQDAARKRAQGSSQLLGLTPDAAKLVKIMPNDQPAYRNLNGARH